MSDCEKYQPYLAALADDDLGAVPAEVVAEVRLHVAGCLLCQAELAQQKGMSRLLTGNPPPAVPGARWQEMWKQVAAETTNRAMQQPATTALQRRFTWRKMTGAAAIAVMIVAAVLLWSVGSSRYRPIGQDLTPVPTLAFATTQDNDIQLVDNSDDEDGDHQTTVVITTGQEDVIVVWVVQDEEPKRST